MVYCQRRHGADPMPYRRRQENWGKPTQEANVAELEKDLKIWSKKNKINSRIQGQLHKERIRATSESGYPKLKAKGAQTRQLMLYSLALAQRFARAEGPHARHDRLIVGVNKLVCDLYALMMSSGRFFSDEAKAKIVGFLPEPLDTLTDISPPSTPITSGKWNREEEEGS